MILKLKIIIIFYFGILVATDEFVSIAKKFRILIFIGISIDNLVIGFYYMIYFFQKRIVRKVTLIFKVQLTAHRRGWNGNI